jgi:hypothetical protein
MPRARSQRWQSYRDAAALLAQCVPQAAGDGRLPTLWRAGLAEAYAVQSVALLRQAARLGYRDGNGLRKVPSLAPLRERRDFQQLLTEIEGNKQP